MKPLPAFDLVSKYLVFEAVYSIQEYLLRFLKPNYLVHNIKRYHVTIDLYLCVHTESDVYCYEQFWELNFFIYNFVKSFFCVFYCSWLRACIFLWRSLLARFCRRPTESHRFSVGFFIHETMCPLSGCVKIQF